MSFWEYAREWLLSCPSFAIDGSVFSLIPDTIRAIGEFITTSGDASDE
jgi:hypothetical protein